MSKKDIDKDNNVFKTKVRVDGKMVEKEFYLRKPSIDDYNEAEKVGNTTFNEALKSGAFLRLKLEEIMREQGLWNDEKQQELIVAQTEILTFEQKLAKGGFNINDAKKVALKIRELREDMKDLISDRASLDNHSAEGKASNAKFSYLLSVCMVYNDTKEPYFKSVEDYLMRNNEEVSIEATRKFASTYYGVDENYEEQLLENKFLIDYGFVDESLRLINRDGELVDDEGRLLDEDGRFIDGKGNFIDKDGNIVTDDGEYKNMEVPFTDDDGNVVVPISKEKKEIKKKTKKSSRTKQLT